MYKEAAEFLFVVNLKNAFDLDIEQGQYEMSWEEFKEELLRHRIRDNKNGVGFMPVMTKPEAEWQELWTKEVKKDGRVVKPSVKHYRGDVNIEAITALVIDLDEPNALDEGQKIFNEYERVVHSTHNYTPETPYKYRMIIRLQEPIPVENWPICFEALKSRIKLDPVCCNPSRFYYYPSHSRNSNITPRADHYHGRAITVDDILALAADKDALVQAKPVKTSKPRPVRPGFTAASVRTRRHFSGAIVGHYDAVPDKIDVSLDAMKKRHAISIAEYEMEGSRHNLALSITSREINRFGPKADLKSLILFVFKIAADGERGLETGNTADELPGMIITGMMKYSPEALEKLMQDHEGDPEPYLSSIVRWASLNYETAPLTIDEVKKPASDSNEYYKVLRERHKPYLTEFVKSGDVRELFKQVLRIELRNEKPKYKEVANALVSYQFGYYTKVEKKSENVAWGLIFAELTQLTRIFSEKNIPVDAQKIKFAKSQFIIATNAKVPESAKTAQKALELNY
ncbi:DNA primase [Pseudomonas putida]|uniref:DNA primase n=1 Tax=Pseudomonas putida TaxID=303 RepID=A0A8I1JHQ8_PSEPU|nr:DNA primase [Pseudomonas putida]MBI6882936.1 DNA primase [Pseudomonas putida]